jgi:hypothetical protein
MILRNDTDEISLSVLDEILLLVYLCSAVFPSVPKSELVSEPISAMCHSVYTIRRLLEMVGTEACTRQF